MTNYLFMISPRVMPPPYKIYFSHLHTHDRDIFELFHKKQIETDFLLSISRDPVDQISSCIIAGFVTEKTPPEDQDFLSDFIIDHEINEYILFYEAMLRSGVAVVSYLDLKNNPKAVLEKMIEHSNKKVINSFKNIQEHDTDGDSKYLQTSKPHVLYDKIKEKIMDHKNLKKCYEVYFKTLEKRANQPFL